MASQEPPESLKVTCQQCHRELEFSGEAPSFCAFCGRPLSFSGLDATVDHTPNPNQASGLRTIPGDIPMPEQIGEYRLVRKIGSGGMGTVFEAEEPGMGRRVAVKLLNAGFEAGTESIDRFRQEGRLASTIAHPRCVFVLAADEIDGQPYIVMELMSGSTLQHLVEERGPLPVEEAVAKVLNIIEGLQEAHRLGVVHRDVKPSNCFLEEDGRVKVGDFGLSKSLSADTHLTRTGAFVGTPLYASPEQIKGDPVDRRTDVYSVAATLYFLLTGHPPFEAPDAAATLAKIVSEDPPPIRTQFPDVPAVVEGIILRGMDRDRERRWKTLDEFREVLLPFAPHPVRGAKPGVRFCAFLIDLLPLAVFDTLTIYLFPESWITILLSLMIWILYFAPAEGYWGSSLGKRLFLLRVSHAESKRPPGFPLAILRTALFYTILWVPSSILSIALEKYWGDWNSFTFWAWYSQALFGPILLGALLLCLTMRPSNGFRALHDLLSGTRVVRLPGRTRRREWIGRRRMGRDRNSTERPVGVLRRVGPYKVRGAIRWEPTRKVLTAEDSTLGREVWVMLRPLNTEPTPTFRRDLSRTTRPRWLASGEQPEGRWDAYVAPAGNPLNELAGPTGLSWGETRSILHDLADELATACEDDTLPEGLTVDQVWVEPDGRVQLLDPLGKAPDPTAVTDCSPTHQQRAIEFLRNVAATALEGGRRRSNDLTTPVRAPVPLHARAILDRLFGVAGVRPYQEIAEIRNDLESTLDEPAELGWPVRMLRAFGFLALIPLRLLIGIVPLALLILLDSPLIDLPVSKDFSRDGLILGLTIASVWIFWAFLTRGGFSTGLLGAAIVDVEGQKPSRVRAAWRESIVWVPLLILVAIGQWIEYQSADPIGLTNWSTWVSWLLPAAWLISCASYDFFERGRMLQDKLSETVVVPK